MIYLLGNSYFAVLRPGQWSKNIFCLAAPALVARSLNIAQWIDVGLVFMAFCALASSVYIFNDLCNKREDQAHPVKQMRPVARGEIGAIDGGIFAFILAICGLMLLAFVGMPTVIVGGSYLLLHVGYSLVVRNIPVVELLFLATGFALRVLAGANAAGIETGWLLLLATYGVSLLLGIGKRRSELSWGEAVHTATRPVLAFYTRKMMTAMIVVTAIVTCVSYSLLVVEHLSPVHAWLSIFFVVIGVLRYMWIILFLEGAERPERLLYSDVVVTTVVVSWCAVFIHAING